MAALEKELQETKARLFEAEANNAAAAAAGEPAPRGSGGTTDGTAATAMAPPQPDIEAIKLEYEAKLVLAGQAFTAYQHEVSLLAAQIQKDTAAAAGRHQAEVAALKLEIERLRGVVAYSDGDKEEATKLRAELERLRAERQKWSSESGQVQRLGERLAERAGELKREMRQQGLGADTLAAVEGDRATKRVRFGSHAQDGDGGGGGGGRPAPKQGRDR